ncbi:MAG TPA: ribosome-associated translation inhibitor RaiA [bacterium]|nr:ribosome-associated translation inhibitor RaiA [bacterium]
MEIHFIKRSDDVTAAMKEYIEDKLTKVEKLPINIIDARIIMDIHKYRHFVEVTLVGKHLTINAKDEDNDMYAAVDKVIDKLDHQLKKFKEIKQGHKFRDGGIKEKEAVQEAEEE